MARIVVVLVIIALVAAFSIQNSSPVAISFLFWRFQASLAIAIFLSAVCGAVAGAILMYVVMRRSWGTKKEDPHKSVKSGKSA